LKKKTTILIIGGGSIISRKLFNNCTEYNIIAFSKYTNPSVIREYKTYKYKTVRDIYEVLSKINSKRVVLLFMESLSIPNLIINKTETEIKKEIFSNIINPHIILNFSLLFLLS
jgi:hypothetical protein